MAITQTSILRVNLTNSYNDSKNVNLRNGRTNITLEQIRTAFAPLLTDTFLAGGEYLTQVKTAKRIITQTTDIE